MVKLVIFLILLAVSVPAAAKVRIKGKVVHYLTQEKVQLAQVNVVYMDSSARFSVVLSSGKYRIALENGFRYRVEYTKQGYYTKYVVIDTRGVPSNKSTSMFIDMDMVEVIDGFDKSVFEQPMGVAYYNQEISEMQWDIEYSRRIFKEVDSAFAARRVTLKGPIVNTQKDESEEVDAQADEAYYPPPPNALKFAWPLKEYVNSDIPVATTTSSFFKNHIRLGVYMTSMYLSGMKKCGENAKVCNKRVNSLLKEMELHTIKFERLCEMEELVQNTSNKYYPLLDSIYRKEGPAEVAYVNLGGCLRAMELALDAYESQPNKYLINFLGDGAMKFAEFYSYWSEMDVLTDAESSFHADLEKLVNVLYSVESISEVTQDDAKPLRYKITEEWIKEVRTNLEHILGAVM